MENKEKENFGFANEVEIYDLNIKIVSDSVPHQH